MVGPTATLQDLEHHGGLSHLAWTGYDLHEPSGLVCAFQQDVGVGGHQKGVCGLFIIMGESTRFNGQIAR